MGSKEEKNLYTSIDDLPIEMILLIFRNLNILDLPNCRLVSKKWKFYVDQTNYKPTELIIEEPSIEWTRLSENEKWHGPMEKRLNLRNKISRLYSFESFPFTLDRLKRLYLNCLVNLSEFNLGHLISRCEQLECLQIFGLTNNDNYSLSLPSTLQNLYLANVISFKLSIDAPALKHLYCTDLKSIQLIHPQTVTHFETACYAVGCSVLSNLECITCHWADRSSSRIINRLPNLKCIKCYQETLHFRHQLKTLNIKMNHLLDQRATFRRDDLRIYFDDHELFGNRRFEDYGFFDNHEF